MRRPAEFPELILGFLGMILGFLGKCAFFVLVAFIIWGVAL